MIAARLLTIALFLAPSSPDALMAELQRAVAGNDRQAVAALVQYPITITTAGVRIPIPDAATLVQTYDAVFTAELKAAIADRSAVRTGLIRIVAVNGVFKITNLAPPFRASTAGDGRPATPAPPPGPRRLTFATVQQVAQFAGSVSAGNPDTFVAFVEKGRLLEARIDRVRGVDVVLKVADAKTGKPVDAKAGEGARTWIGRVPESADYRIDVTRTPQASGQTLPYMLVVRKR
jgi:hypothetical protein